ncbi:MAG: contractile injection system protein, VgrG/Pvc8 family [Myxococcota bacterium]|jgi:hypothetical protein|nr:contractile injection system protein, VgrG/Pvc8 family [Myxococcota bacterium]
MGTTSTKSAVPAVNLTIGSTKVDQTNYFDIIEVVVDQLADGPSMAYAKLNTHDLEWIDKADIAPTKPFKVDLGFGGGSSETPTPLFDGTVHGWEPQFYGKSPTTLIVRGINALHTASRGRKTQGWLDKKISDVASEIAGRNGMGTGGIEDTKITQPFIYQANLTDLEFLRELGERVGYEVGCDVQKNLMFRKPKVDQGPAVTFTWGENMKRFRARMNTANTISKVKVAGWDPKQKKSLFGEASTTDVKKMGGSASAGDVAKKFEKGAAQLYLHDRVYYSPDDATAEAKGLIQDLGLNLIVAEIEGEGDAAAQAGKVVKLAKVGKRFEGDYYIIRARHVLRIEPKLPDFGYVCYLTVRRSGVTPE